MLKALKTVISGLNRKCVVESKIYAYFRTQQVFYQGLGKKFSSPTIHSLNNHDHFFNSIGSFMYIKAKKDSLLKF